MTPSKKVCVRTTSMEKALPGRRVTVGFDAKKVITILLVTSLVGAIALTLHLATTAPPGEPFTEFSILGPGGQADDYPTNLTLGEEGTVILSIVNREYAETSYRIVIQLDNTTLDTRENITLQHEEAYEQAYTFTPEQAGDQMKLAFLLHRDEGMEVYRSLHLWLTVHPA